MVIIDIIYQHTILGFNMRGKTLLLYFDIGGQKFINYVSQNLNHFIDSAI